MVDGIVRGEKKHFRDVEQINRGQWFVIMTDIKLIIQDNVSVESRERFIADMMRYRSDI